MRLEIVERFLKGESIRKIAQSIGLSHTGLSYQLRKLGLDTRPKRYAIQIPTVDLNNEEFCYWLGFLLADGNVTKTGKVQLGLQKRDIDHIKKFRTFLKSDHPIFIDKGSPRIIIANKQLCELFAQFGIVPCKSLITLVDDRLANNKHFWRGMVDGDGSVSWAKKRYKKYFRVRLCGTLHVCQKWQSFLIANDIDASSNAIQSMKSIYELDIQGVKALRAADLIYADTSVYLDRKYQTYLTADGCSSHNIS